MNEVQHRVKRFFRNVRLLALTEIILKFKTFMLMPFLVRHFGVVDYGAWSQVAILVATISPIVVLGTESAIMRFLPGIARERQERIFASWLLFLTGTSLMAGGVLVLSKEFLVKIFWGNNDFIELIPLAAGAIIVIVFQNTIKTWLRIFDNAKGYSSFLIVQSIFNLLATMLVLIQKKPLYELVLYTLAADIFLIILCFVRIFPYMKFFPLQINEIKKFVIFGSSIVPAGYAMWAINSSDRIFLIQYTDLASIGIYSIAYSMGYLIIQLFVNPIWTMYPNNASNYYNQDKVAELKSLFSQTRELIVMLAIPAICGLYFVGDELLTWYSGYSFSGNSQVMVVIAIGYLMHMMASYDEVSLSLVGKPYLATISIGIAALANLIANMLLIPKYGLLGAAIATLVGFMVQFFISTFLGRRLFPIAEPHIIKLTFGMGISAWALGWTVRYSLLYFGQDSLPFILWFILFYGGSWAVMFFWRRRKIFDYFLHERNAYE